MFFLGCRQIRQEVADPLVEQGLQLLVPRLSFWETFLGGGGVFMSCQVVRLYKSVCNTMLYIIHLCILSSGSVLTLLSSGIERTRKTSYCIQMEYSETVSYCYQKASREFLRLLHLFHDFLFEKLLYSRSVPMGLLDVIYMGSETGPSCFASQRDFYYAS